MLGVGRFFEGMHHGEQAEEGSVTDGVRAGSGAGVVASAASHGAAVCRVGTAARAGDVCFGAGAQRRAQRGQECVGEFSDRRGRFGAAGRGTRPAGRSGRAVFHRHAGGDFVVCHAASADLGVQRLAAGGGALRPVSGLGCAGAARAPRTALAGAAVGWPVGAEPECARRLAGQRADLFAADGARLRRRSAAGQPVHLRSL